MTGFGISGNVLFTRTNRKTGKVDRIRAKNTVRGVAGTWAREGLYNNTRRGYYYNSTARCWLYNSSRVVQSGNTHLINSSNLTTGRVRNLNSTTGRTSSGASMTYSWEFSPTVAYSVSRAYWLIPNGSPTNNIHVLAYVDPSSAVSVGAGDTLTVAWTFTFSNQSGSGILSAGLNAIASRLSGGLTSEEWNGFTVRWDGTTTDENNPSITGNMTTTSSIATNNSNITWTVSGTNSANDEVNVNNIQLANGSGSNATVYAQVAADTLIGNGSSYSGSVELGGLRH